MNLIKILQLGIIVFGLGYVVNYPFQADANDGSVNRANSLVLPTIPVVVPLAQIGHFQEVIEATGQTPPSVETGELGVLFNKLSHPDLIVFRCVPPERGPHSMCQCIFGAAEEETRCSGMSNECAARGSRSVVCDPTTKVCVCKG
jgi:hypothetical protein